MWLQAVTGLYASGPPLQRTATRSKRSRGEGERQGQGKRLPTNGCTRKAAETPAVREGSALVTAHTSTHRGETQEHPRGMSVTSAGQMETLQRIPSAAVGDTIGVRSPCWPRTTHKPTQPTLQYLTDEPCRRDEPQARIAYATAFGIARGACAHIPHTSPWSQHRTFAS